MSQPENLGQDLRRIAKILIRKFQHLYVCLYKVQVLRFNCEVCGADRFLVEDFYRCWVDFSFGGQKTETKTIWNLTLSYVMP